MKGKGCSSYILLPFLPQKITLVNSCFLFYIPSPNGNGVCTKRKQVALYRVKAFPLDQIPFIGGDKKNYDNFFPCKFILSPVKDIYRQRKVKYLYIFQHIMTKTLTFSNRKYLYVYKQTTNFYLLNIIHVVQNTNSGQTIRLV